MDKILWLCDPSKNAACDKRNCYINGGPCFHTAQDICARTEFFADGDAIRMQDTLDYMLKVQAAFQDRVDPRYNSPDPAVRADFIRDHSLHCIQELGEMLQEVPYYKGWKDYSKMDSSDIITKYDKAKEELIDAWHFFMNLALALGLTADEFFDIYLSKNKENIRRQDEGYDHTMNHIHIGGKAE